MKQRKLTGFVLAALLFCGGMIGCGGSDGAELTKRVKPLEIEPLDGTAEFCDAQMQFAVSMLHQAAEKAEENYVISPYLAAEAWLTAAAGSSAIQTSEAFGSISLSLLNGSFVRWRETQTDFTEVMSLWIPAAEKNSMSPDVLRTFLGLSNTQVFAADQKQNELERWLYDVSGDAFSGVSVPEDAGRILFSAASVSMKWNTPFYDNDTVNKFFTGANGQKQSVPFLCKEEDSAVVIDDDTVRGLRRECGGNKYWFLALMPKSGTVGALLGSLTQEQLSDYIRSGTETTVRTVIPKLTLEETQDVSALVPAAGVPLIQHVRAEIGQGTDSAVFGMNLGEEVTSSGQIVLDHPFVFFLIDRQYGLPLFAGAVNRLPVK